MKNVIKNSKGSGSEEFSNKETLGEGMDWGPGRKENAQPAAGFPCRPVNQASIPLTPAFPLSTKQTIERCPTPHEATGTQTMQARKGKKNTQMQPKIRPDYLSS